MVKPDWADAPEWANWLARDLDGQWNWFECEPSSGCEHDCVYWHPRIWGEGEWDAAMDTHETCETWKETLEQRP